MKKRVKLIEVLRPTAIYLSVFAIAFLMVNTFIKKTTPEIFFIQSPLSLVVIISLFLAGNAYVCMTILKNGLSIKMIIFAAAFLGCFLASHLTNNIKPSDLTCVLFFIICFLISLSMQLYSLKVLESALKEINR